MPPKCSPDLSPEVSLLTFAKLLLYTSILYISPTPTPDQLGLALLCCSLLTIYIYIYMCIYVYIYIYGSNAYLSKPSTFCMNNLSNQID